MVPFCFGIFSYPSYVQDILNLNCVNTKGQDIMKRCDWCGNDPLYVKYHDTEWGVPEYASQALWEKLVLDGFQAGLSWITVLKKRDAFRLAFKGFNPHAIAEFTYIDVDGNGAPLGLAFTLTTVDADTEGDLTIILRHEPSKSADGVAGGDITNAGGETDIAVTFPFTIE